MSPDVVQLLAIADVNHVACRALEAQGIFPIGVFAKVAPTRGEVVPAILGGSSMASELTVAACLQLARQMAHVLSRNATMPRPFSVTTEVPETSVVRFPPPQQKVSDRSVLGVSVSDASCPHCLVCA